MERMRHMLDAAGAVVAADPAIEVDFAQIEWSLLARMRDKVTHQYWAVDPEIVWSTAVRDVTVIRTLLAQALR